MPKTAEPTTIPRPGQPDVEPEIQTPSKPQEDDPWDVPEPKVKPAPKA